MFAVCMHVWIMHVWIMHVWYLCDNQRCQQLKHQINYHTCMATSHIPVTHTYIHTCIIIIHPCCPCSRQFRRLLTTASLTLLNLSIHYRCHPPLSIPGATECLFCLFQWLNTDHDEVGEASDHWRPGPLSSWPACPPHPLLRQGTCTAPDERTSVEGTHKDSTTARRRSVVRGCT